MNKLQTIKQHAKQLAILNAMNRRQCYYSDNNITNQSHADTIDNLLYTIRDADGITKQICICLVNVSTMLSLRR